MSKAKPAEPEIEPREGVQDFFINSLGRVVYCNPLPHDQLSKVENEVEKSYRSRGEPLDPPTYSFQAEGGGQVTVVHDEATILDPKTSEEDKAAWAKHQDALRRFVAERDDRSLRYLCIRGVKVDVTGSEFKDWLEEERFITGTVPESEFEQRYQFIRSRLVVTTMEPDNPEKTELLSDRLKLMETCFLLGFKGATREQIEGFKDFFRLTVGGFKRGDSTAEGVEPSQE